MDDDKPRSMRPFSPTTDSFTLHAGAGQATSRRWLLTRRMGLLAPARMDFGILPHIVL